MLVSPTTIGLLGAASVGCFFHNQIYTGLRKAYRIYLYKLYKFRRRERQKELAIRRAINKRRVEGLEYARKKKEREEQHRKDKLMAKLKAEQAARQFNTKAYPIETQESRLNRITKGRPTQNIEAHLTRERIRAKLEAKYRCDTVEVTSQFTHKQDMGT